MTETAQTPATRPARRKFLGAAVTGAAAMSAPMISVAQSPVVLKMQGAWGAKDLFNEMAEEYVTRVNEMAGGRLRIESAPGRGTCVEIVLPRAKVEPARRSPVPAVREPRDHIRTPWLRQVLECWDRRDKVSAIAKPNAMVLPDPVWADTKRSRPCASSSTTAF